MRSRPTRTLIQPVPKVPAPTTDADFRPISITPVLTRIFEKIIVHRYIYPALLAPPHTLTLSVLPVLLEQVEYEPWISARQNDNDTVRHSAVLQRLAQLDIPDHIFNWISDYLQDHSHCTVYNNYSSDFRTLSASIIQGSGVRPSLYTVFHKKTTRYLIAHNLGKCWPIFKILSLSDSAVNV